MDLNAKNDAAFRRQLAPCVEHAHGTGKAHGTGRGGLRPAGHGARTSGRRKTRASRSATAAHPRRHRLALPSRHGRTVTSA
jgi:hypothetical protein